MSNKKFKINIKEVIRASYNMTASPKTILASDLVNLLEDDIPVIKYTDRVHSIGSLFAICGSLQNFNGELKPAIFVDEYFNELPETVKDFLMYHELGHIKLKHFEGNNQKNSFINELKNSLYVIKRNFRIELKELQADNYAVKQIGKEKSIESLNYLLNNIIGINKKEIKERINVILNNMI